MGPVEIRKRAERAERLFAGLLNPDGGCYYDGDVESARKLLRGLLAKLDQPKAPNHRGQGMATSTVLRRGALHKPAAGGPRV